MAPSAVAVRHVRFEDLGLLDALLTKRGYRVRYLEAGVDELASAVAGADLLVVLGGPIGVYDDDRYPFLGVEQTAIAARLAACGPTLGVCLGAQLMARAMGAAVTATGRIEIGYSPLGLTDAGRGSVLAPLNDHPVLHWHGDQFEIPAGADRLAETPGFPNQAFSVGRHGLGLQFHLEADHARIEQWLIGHAHELAAHGIDPRQIRSDAQELGPGLARRSAQVMHAWIDGLG